MSGTESSVEQKIQNLEDAIARHEVLVEDIKKMLEKKKRNPELSLEGLPDLEGELKYWSQELEQNKRELDSLKQERKTSVTRAGKKTKKGRKSRKRRKTLRKSRKSRKGKKTSRR